MGKSTTKNPVVSNPSLTPGNPNPRATQPRDQIDDFHDPYLPEGSYPEDTVCSGCGAVWHNQHWNLDPKRRDLLLSAGAANEVTCPGCKIIAERNPQGIVRLRGDYWPEHREDILNLIRNEEARGVQDNPIARIMEIREEGDSLIVETTNEKLAQRIGRAVEKAHKGSLDFRWPDGNQLVRIYWERSLA